MMNQPRWKILLLTLTISTLVGGLMLPARPARAYVIWSNVYVDKALEWAQVWADQDQHDAIADGFKSAAMQMWQTMVMQQVAGQGGFVLNYGEYIFGSGDSAAAKYWNAFLQNCTNIDPNVSLSIKANVVDQGGAGSGVGYDWCPVRINVRGVNIQTDLNLSAEYGWDDFNDLIDNNAYKQYFQLAEQTEEARQDAMATKYLEATASGNKPKTTEVSNAPNEGQTGPPSPSDIASREQVQIPAQVFQTLMDAATGGVVAVSANQKSLTTSAMTFMLLQAASQLMLNGTYD